jgi:hypothetical protein
MTAAGKPARCRAIAGCAGGITLVQFDVIVRKAKVLAQQISIAVQGCPAPCADNYALGLAIMGFFGAAGFLMMYLWSRIYLLLDVARIQDKLDRDALTFSQLRKSGRVEGTRPDRNLLEYEAKQAGDAMPKPVDIKPGADLKDPWKGVFGSSRSSDRELGAIVKNLPASDYCQVRLTVRSTAPSKPLQGEVTFFLHDTFPEPVQTVTATNGEAVLEIASWGAFTVGAVADGGDTKLELDLSTLSDAPAEWRNR